MELEETLRKVVMRKYDLLEKKLAKYELVKGQADLLLMIKDHDGITQNELAEMIGIKDSSMSVRLRKLEKLSYITRIVEESNLKKKRIYITTVGKSICGQCRRFVREYEELVLKGFSKKDKQQLENYLERIEKNVQR